jgi:uncharacterized protein YndB with AHSA1/START domain
MNSHASYQPGPAAGAEVEKDGDKWTLVVTRALRHPPARVWEAITEPAHLKEWAWYDSDTSLAQTTKPVKLSTVGAPNASETMVKRAEAPRLLELNLGPQEIRFELEPNGAGTTLKIWHLIDRRYIAMGAAGWHVSLDMLEKALGGEPMGRLSGPGAMQNPGWQKLHAEYSTLFGVEMPKWG